MPGRGPKGEGAPHVLFLCASEGLQGAADLRRLGAPALLLERRGWRCSLRRAGEALPADVDVVVVPIAVLPSLPQLGAPGGASRLVVEIDGDPELDCPDAAELLSGLAGRIRAVVARTAAASGWARRVLPDAAIRLALDPAADGVAIDAAGCRFGAAPPLDPPPVDWPESFELWFAEPGDRVDDNEFAQLKAAWRPEAPPLLLAPAPVLDTLGQHGIEGREVVYSPERLDEALARAARCVFAGPETEALLRRLARACAAGAAISPDPRLPAYAPAAVAEQWAEILDDVMARAPGAEDAPPTVVLFLLDLVQDLDLALPVIDELRKRPDVVLRVAVSGWLRRRSPRVAIELGARDVLPETYDRSTLERAERPVLDGVDAVVAVVESDRSAHARAHALFARARARGLPTFSFQHGVENLGLNAPAIEEETEPHLHSEHLFVWFPEAHTPDTVHPALRPRLVHIGRPMLKRPAPSALLGALAEFDTVAAVFENLHWSRYDVSWRRRFLFDCAEFAASDSTRAVVLKPHHGGLWSVRNKHLIPQWPTNLILADPTDTFWEPHTAPALLQAADLVVTTPSTVALDAVQAGKPVAVAAYGLDLPAYAPLPLLHDIRDWTAFAQDAASPADARRRAAFLGRTNRRGDAAAAAADYIVAVGRDRTAARTPRREAAA